MNQTQEAAASRGRWPAAGTFVEALASRDFTAMAGCLDPDVRVRALLPPGLVEVTGKDAAIGIFRMVFDDPDDLVLIDATVGEVGPRLYLRWRAVLTPAARTGPGRLVEQHVFATAGERITAMDLLCSGFVAVPAVSADHDEEIRCPEKQ